MNHAIFREHTLRIPTPEQIYLEYPLAGLGRRGLAAAIDSAIISCALLVLIILFSIMLGGIVAASADSPNMPPLVIVFFIVMFAVMLLTPFLYYFLFEYFGNGQTPGKRLVNIRVIRASGLSLDRTSSALRNLFRLIDMIPSYYLVGVWSTLLTSKQQRLGDLVANTVVIALPPKGSREGVQAGTAGLTGTSAPRVYSNSREQALHWLVYQYLSRRQLLNPAARRSTATELASAMGLPLQDLGELERDLWARITSP